MTTFLQFALLGLGAGGAYAISGIGMTQVYRGSGVLNLSHGSIALFSGVLFVWAYQRWSLPFPVAAAIAVLVAAVIGALIETLVMHPLRDAAVLVRVIATLGVFAILQQAVPLIFGTSYVYEPVSTYYPTGVLHLGHTISIPYNRLIMVGVTLVLGLVLRTVMDRTNFGLATTASAENPLVAATMRIDAGRTALYNWMIGSALAGLAGVLLIPILGSLLPDPLLLLIIPTLAACLIGRFSSYGLTIAGGLLLGVGQSLLTRYQSDIFPSTFSQGWPAALPFLVIVVVLVVGGTPFPRRGDIATRLPRVGRAIVHPVVGVAISIVAAAVMLVTSDYLASVLIGIAGVAIVGLSLVMITGLAGQTSLAQLSISGLAALLAARVSHSQGWPFPVVLVIGVVTGALTGLIFTLPALRTRGQTLAIATIGIGVAIENVALDNGKLTLSQSYSGTPVKSPTLFGIDLNAFNHPQRYASLVVLALGLLAVAVSNLRASPTGRRLLAVRSSERAAAASGISLSGAKTAAFVVAACVAAIGGVLLAFQYTTVSYDQFNLLSSLNLVIFTIIGGVGYVIGPVIGALLSPNGLITYFVNGHASIQRWFTILGGFGLIMMLISYPHGQAWMGESLGHRLRRRIKTRGPREAPELPPRNASTLNVRGLTVRYGNVTAVSDLDITVEPGQIVGLIGPNGAGKTSALDAITGFCPATATSLDLGEQKLLELRAHQRARAGIRRTFQTVELFDDLTVGENIGVALERVKWSDWFLDLLHRRPLALPPSVRHAAEVVGLDQLDAEPSSLSQGHGRLLGVMRAIAANASVVLLDEPAAGLNSAETAELGEVLREIARQHNVGILLVEHDLTMVAAICDYVVAIDFGRVIFQGTAEDALEDAAIRTAYLGPTATDVVQSPGIVEGAHQ